VRVATLAAWYVEYTRAVGQSKQFDETRHFLSVALRREEKTVLTEIVGVECRLPPLGRLLQKNTGSR
jgi:hypothetical protein